MASGSRFPRAHKLIDTYDRLFRVYLSTQVKRRAHGFVDFDKTPVRR
jgi:hypothetical protein